MVRRVAFGCIFLSLALHPTVSGAQVNPFQSSRIGTGLNNADRQAMGTAAQQLIRQDTVLDGASDKWSNPKSGNSGTITVLHSFTRSGMACRRVRYDFHLAQRANPRSYTVNWCKTPSGQWKVA